MRLMSGLLRLSSRNRAATGNCGRALRRHPGMGYSGGTCTAKHRGFQCDRLRSDVPRWRVLREGVLKEVVSLQIPAAMYRVDQYITGSIYRSK